MTVDGGNAPDLNRRNKAVKPDDLLADPLYFFRQLVHGELKIHEVRMLYRGFHPKEIPEGKQGTEKKIMKEHEILAQVYDLLAITAAYKLQLVEYVL